MKYLIVFTAFLTLYVNGCSRKDESPSHNDTTAAKLIASSSPTHCCADSTNEYPGGVPNAFSFVVNTACTVEVDIASMNSGGATERFTYTFTKDAAAYIPVGEPESTITIIVPAGGTVPKTFTCTGPGSFLVTATCSLKSGPNSWTPLSPVDPPATAIVGAITDTSYVTVDAPKQWMLKPSETVKGTASFSICRNELPGMMMMKAPEK